MNEVPETVQFDVKPPKPRTRKVLTGMLAAVLLVAVMGAAVAATTNHTGPRQVDPTTSVMPANTILYLSLNLHAEKLPNFNVIAEAWKDSKGARQVASALELGFMQAGLNWEEDLQPWLGERAAVALIDLGGRDYSVEQSFAYRTPFYMIVAQTKDRAKSDAVLAGILKQLSKRSNGTIETETYRDIVVTYINSRNKYIPENSAFATIDDLVVLTPSRDYLKTAINAALDGQNLSASENYRTVINTLPDQNAGAFYVDFSLYVNEAIREFAATARTIEASKNKTYDLYTGIYSNTQTTPDPSFLEQEEKRKLRQAEERRQQEQQEEERLGFLRVLGGLGIVMTYEPTGIRFDLTAQYDVTNAPEKWRKYLATNQTPASNHIFSSLPSSAIIAGNGNVQDLWKMLLDPEYWALSLSSTSRESQDEIANKLDEFQKLTGMDLKADFLDLLTGEVALVMLPQTEQTRSELGSSMPFQFAALFDSSDAAKASGGLDKIMQAVSTLTDEGGVKWQSLSSRPYSLVRDRQGNPMFTYGAVDGRLVVGTNSDTLFSIDNAEQAPLSNSDLFKQATSLLPSNRLNTFFMNFQPLWDWVEAQAQGDVDVSLEIVFNYLSHFKWLSSGNEAPATGLQHGSLHIGVGQ